jgi:hypothetical protein
MATRNFSELIVKVDDTVGGALQSLAAWGLEMNGFETNAITERSDGFGKSWVENLFAGLREAKPVTLTMFYDDAAAPSPKTMFVGKEGEQRTLEVTYGGTGKSTVETLIQTVKRLPKRGEMHKLEVTLLPTGAVVEA